MLHQNSAVDAVHLINGRSILSAEIYYKSNGVRCYVSDPVMLSNDSRL